jgi:hypothetical protein
MYQDLSLLYFLNIGMNIKSNEEKAHKPIISEQYNSRAQIDLVDFFSLYLI